MTERATIRSIPKSVHDRAKKHCEKHGYNFARWVSVAMLEKIGRDNAPPKGDVVQLRKRLPVLEDPAASKAIASIEGPPFWRVF